MKTLVRDQLGKSVHKPEFFSFESWMLFGDCYYEFLQ